MGCECRKKTHEELFQVAVKSSLDKRDFILLLHGNKQGKAWLRKTSWLSFADSLKFTLSILSGYVVWCFTLKENPDTFNIAQHWWRFKTDNGIEFTMNRSCFIYIYMKIQFELLTNYNMHINSQYFYWIYNLMQLWVSMDNNTLGR